MTISLALGSPALSGLPGEGAVQTALPVKLVTVRAAPRALDLQLVGTVDAANSYPGAFRSSGRILEIGFETGDRVAAGSVSARIDAAQAENTRASLARAEDAAGCSTLTAPRPCIVQWVASEPDETVTSGAGVMEIADLDGRNALIDVAEDFADLLPEGAMFTVHRQGQEVDPVPAILSLIEPTSNTSLGTRRLRVTVAAPPKDFRISSLVGASKPPASAPVMTLPRVAIVEGGGSPQVWRVAGTERRITLVPVTLGKEIGDRVVVTQGVAVGDKIVTRGIRSLTEGLIVGEALE